MPIPVEDEPDCLSVDEFKGDALSVTSTSYFSSNYTESNLPGAGRVLGLAYDSAGRRLERAIGKVAQKVGYRPRPYAVYQEVVNEMSQAGWMNDEKKSVLFFIFLSIYIN